MELHQISEDQSHRPLGPWEVVAALVKLSVVEAAGAQMHQHLGAEAERQTSVQEVRGEI